MRRFRRSARVADESSLEGAEHGHHEEHRHGGWLGISAVLAVVRIPLELVSCIMGQTEDGGELVTASDMNELMVRDGMRFAIYV
ncbi:hypothetical protein COCNU_11G010740 [Cocos nucifera]|uniref:Uncharacterized protein n=1 Tax=Cocos nucifera TaxID=13894 RepID=A0A8K0IPK4_COCNU|nr:hypothetical protein COCNU_11G010740 [Cocos nucifera]